MALRSLLILIFPVVGLGLVIYGWSMTGKMAGLIIMIVGVILLPVSYTHLGTFICSGPSRL